MKDHNQHDITDLLRDLPDLEPPHGMTDNIMAGIRPKRKNWFRILLQGVRHQRSIHLGPLPIACAFVMIFSVFWFGVEFGKLQTQKSVSRLAGEASPAVTIFGAEANFIAGKRLLEAGLAEEALELLRKAALASPRNPEYAYWEGVCYWAIGEPDKERQSYVRGLAEAPDAVPLLLNLGHNYLSGRLFESALFYYNRVLDIDPEKKEAMYNKGLIFTLKKDRENEKAAWTKFLKHFRGGREAFRALHRLQGLGDYSYRSYQLGWKRVILNQEVLLRGGSQENFDAEVSVLTDTLLLDPELVVDIVVFSKDDLPAAKEQAKRIKLRMLDKLDGDIGYRIRLSWFGEEETHLSGGKAPNITESILIFGRYNIFLNKETEV